MSTLFPARAGPRRHSVREAAAAAVAAVRGRGRDRRAMEGLMEQLQQAAAAAAGSGDGSGSGGTGGGGGGGGGGGLEELLSSMPGGVDAARKHASSMWSFLDELAESDAEGYKRFLNEQMANAKASGMVLPGGMSGAPGGASGGAQGGRPGAPGGAPEIVTPHGAARAAAAASGFEVGERARAPASARTDSSAGAAGGRKPPALVILCATSDGRRASVGLWCASSVGEPRSRRPDGDLSRERDPRAVELPLEWKGGEPLQPSAGARELTFELRVHPAAVRRAAHEADAPGAFFRPLLVDRALRFAERAAGEGVRLGVGREIRLRWAQGVLPNDDLSNTTAHAQQQGDRANQRLQQQQPKQSQAQLTTSAGERSLLEQLSNLDIPAAGSGSQQCQSAEPLLREVSERKVAARQLEQEQQQQQQQQRQKSSGAQMPTKHPAVESPGKPLIQEVLAPEHSVSETTSGIQVCVSLPMLDSAASVDLDVGERDLRLVWGNGGGGALSVPLPSRVDGARARAKWLKRDKVLRVGLERV